MSTSSFDLCVEFILREEGGYTPGLPDDPGGATNRGITKRCLDPLARVLCADLTWRPVGDLSVGSRLIGFDEIPEIHGKKRIRRFRPTTVTSIGPIRLPSVHIVTDLGEITTSTDHLFLRRHGAHRRYEWTKAGVLQGPRAGAKFSHVGMADRLMFLGAPWSKDASWESGYLAGILDGEGSTNRGHVSFSQNLGLVADLAVASAEAIGFRFKGQVRRGLLGNFSFSEQSPHAAMRLLGIVRPARIRDAYIGHLWGRTLDGRYSQAALIRAIEPVGHRDLIGLETTTRTLFAEGFATHNSYPDLDIPNLTREQVISIYQRDYWTLCGAPLLPPALALVVFDAAVNQGARTAARLLQEVLGVTVDGSVGPETAAAAQRRMGLDLIERYLAKRIERYSQAANWPTWDQSWTIRILRVHRVALALL